MITYFYSYLVYNRSSGAKMQWGEGILNSDYIKTKDDLSNIKFIIFQKILIEYPSADSDALSIHLIALTPLSSSD